MEFNKTLIDYILSHTSTENEYLRELNRETHLKVLKPRMLSGHLQGRLLAMFSKMIQPENILEIGTFTGYSSICLAEGLKEGGSLHTIEVNEELEEIATRYFKKSGLQEKIHLHIGSALDIIPKLAISFNLVFIDADKLNYSRYYNLVFDKVCSGGFILIDNVLWDGKVTQTNKTDKKTQAIIDLNKKIQEDTRVENILIPIRDGLMLLQKK